MVIPHGADQFYWAHHANIAGLGPKGPSRSGLTKRSLTAALRELLQDSRYGERAHSVGERLRTVDGVSNAVAYLERKYATRAA